MAFGVDTMTITTANGRFVYDIEVATTPQQQARGLMYRTSLGVNKGMLFIFPREQMQAFWMANTLIPLDMVFIDAEARLVSIQREAEPLSRTSRPSEGQRALSSKSTVVKPLRSGSMPTHCSNSARGQSTICSASMPR